MSGNILQMTGISKSFPGVKALQDVNLSVVRGEVHAVCGENGAGKSTLMKVLSGVYPHGSYEGEILLDGEPVSFRDIKDSERSGFVIIHQELALSPYSPLRRTSSWATSVRPADSSTGTKPTCGRPNCSSAWDWTSTP